VFAPTSDQATVKKGGFALALLLAISGILRVVGPGSASAPRTEVPGKKKQSPAKPITTTYPEDLRHTIQEFYGLWTEDHSALTELAAHWNVPLDSRPNVRFVIAVLADPVHTHLALSFDRGVEALQQAAQTAVWERLL